jgi:2-amino-4-hydroxy-6-hydroxymethyldihydropteridine diphosphokinase
MSVPKSREAENEPALDRFDIFVEPTKQGDDLDRFSIRGALVDALLMYIGGTAFGVGAPSASLRIRDRSTGAIVYEYLCGRNHLDGERLAEILRQEAEELTVSDFLREHHIDLDHSGAEYRRAYLGIGSNIGDRLNKLQFAVAGLQAAEGVRVRAVSQVYETDPVGGPPQPEYLNAVVQVDTTLDAHELLDLAQRLERDAQRVRTERWGPRTLDVDVLILGDEQVDDPDLEIPHPRMRTRGFVLAPLSDFLPEGVIATPDGGWAGVLATDLSLELP